jgi:hypothetical protein
MSGVGGLENARTLELHGTSASKVNVGRGVEAQAGVAVLVVVLMRVIGDHRAQRRVPFVEVSTNAKPQPGLAHSFRRHRSPDSRNVASDFATRNVNGAASETSVPSASRGCGVSPPTSWRGKPYSVSPS